MHAERFGTRWELRAVAIGALCLWVIATAAVLLIAAMKIANVTPDIFISLAFFDFLFAVTALYYHHKAIVVEDDGLIVVGALSFRSMVWADVLHVAVDPGFLPSYQVYTRRGSFGFSRLEFADHERLYHLIRARQRQPTVLRASEPPSRLAAAARLGSRRSTERARHARRRMIDSRRFR